MGYLLDSNVFIRSKNLEYGMDFCPAFWEWIEREHYKGAVFSVEKVGDDIRAVEDQLKLWADSMPPTFFLTPDDRFQSAIEQLNAWLYHAQYDPSAVFTFQNVSDYYLVAQALAGRHTVVTHEVPSNSTKKIKIPNACHAVKVKVMNPYEMLRLERARFVLGPKS